ncbi:hypothetical protein F4808DRAFT_467610 [Astrocystis sublimbata]|nr:hypothetical protein F4808DRAFT_467610 [Astrocystis sublimbata]
MAEYSRNPSSHPNDDHDSVAAQGRLHHSREHGTSGISNPSAANEQHIGHTPPDPDGRTVCANCGCPYRGNYSRYNNGGHHPMFHHLLNPEWNTNITREVSPDLETDDGYLDSDDEESDADNDPTGLPYGDENRHVDLRANPEIYPNKTPASQFQSPLQPPVPKIKRITIHDLLKPVDVPSADDAHRWYPGKWYGAPRAHSPNLKQECIELDDGTERRNVYELSMYPRAVAPAAATLTTETSTSPKSSWASAGALDQPTFGSGTQARRE